MAHFSRVWEYLQAFAKKKEWAACWELLSVGLGALLLHTDLGAAPSPLVSASDALMVGGAVGTAAEVSRLGKDFRLCDCNEDAQGQRIPVLDRCLTASVAPEDHMIWQDCSRPSLSA